MTLAVGKRFKITGSDFDSSLSVTADAAAWSGATAYVVDDEAIRQRASDLQWFWYVCIQAHTNKDPNTAANIGTYWVLKSAAGRSIPFDDAVSQSPEVAASFYYWRVEASSVIAQYIGVFGAGGDELKITKLTNQFDGVTLNANSENFDNTVNYTRVGLSAVNANVAADPLTGMFLADELVEDTSTGNHGFTDPLAGLSYTSGLSYYLSVYVKSSTRNLRLEFGTAPFGAGKAVNFTLSGAGSVTNFGGATGTITSLADGWYLCVAVATATATTTGSWGIIKMLSGSTESYTGSTSNKMTLFGYNTVQGSSFSTYYCKFGGEAFTRSILKTHEFVYNAVLYPDATPYNPSVLVATGSTPSSWYEVQVTKNSVDDRPRIGEIVLVYDVETLGQMIQPLDESLLDFSVKTRDDFGNVSLIPRNVADDINYTFYMDKTDRNRIKNVLKDRRGQPLVFFDDTDVENDLGIMSFGFLSGYSMPLLPSDVQIVSLDTEGLT